MADVPLVKSPVALTELDGADTAADGEVPTSDGAGGVAWETPAGGGSSAFVGCRLTASADQGPLTPSTHTPVVWNQETFDTDAYHDNATNNTRATIPTGLGGKYRISGAVGWQGVQADKRVMATLHIDGTADATSREIHHLSTASNASIGFSWLVALNAGQYVEVAAWCDAATPTIDQASSHFALEFLGA
jgi:hypothetical protein